jgi:hypothetical protein
MMVSLRQIHKAFLVTVTLCFGLSLAENDPRQDLPAHLSELANLTPVTLDGDTFGLLVREGSNCLAHEMSAPGQALHASGSALHASGSVGGLVPFPNPSPEVQSIIFPFNNPDVEEVESRHDQSVGILVVDEFSGVYSVNVEEVLQSLLPWGQQELVAQHLADLKTNKHISHGALVMDHINALTLGTGNYDLERQPSGEAISPDGVITWQHKQQQNKRLVVMGVDVATGGTINTELITGEIISALDVMQDFGDEGIDTIIVNMSFILLPCAILEDFLASSVDTFDEYTAALIEINGEDPDDANIFRAFGSLISTPLETRYRDPLSCLVDDLIGAEEPDEEEPGCEVEFDGSKPSAITFVASAGNLNDKHDRLDFPMYPAAWDNVISVSARTHADPTRRVDFSNPGQVMATGAWFALSDWQHFADRLNEGNPLPENTQIQESVAYAGTSFAAPSMTVAAAMYQACQSAQLPDWNNTSLEDALSLTGFCQ